MPKLNITERSSSIELLKILAIFLIVVQHVTQTLGSVNNHVSFQDYVIPLGTATSDIQVIILMLMRQAGMLGNAIFFTCSAWFLIGKKADATSKAFSLLCSVWTVSMIFLLTYLVVAPSCLTTKEIIKQIFPTCFANNWYMTCYIIFLFIYPWINKFIDVIDQRQLLRMVIFSSSLWIVLDYLKGDMFFPSMVILWVSIYFLMSYLKLYCVSIMKNIKIGTGLLIVGITGYIAQVVVTNYVGLYFIGALAGKVLRWNSNCSPFYIMIAIGAIIVATQIEFKKHIINYVSSLTMFIYLIHENYLFRTYTRPTIWQYLYEYYGYEYVVLLDMGYVIVLFLTSVIVSAVYKETIQKIVIVISNGLYTNVSCLYRRFEESILKIN